MYWIAKALARLMAMLPPRAIRLFGRLGGLLWYYIIPVRKKLAIDNVSASITGGDRVRAAAIVKSNMINLFTGALEAGARLLKEPEAWTIEGLDAFKAHLSTGKGAILAVAHTGNWDLNELIATQVGVKLYLVTRRIRNKGLQRFWEEIRARRGNTYFPQDAPASDLLKVVRGGGVLTLAFDQNMPPKHGVRVPFFGRSASTTFAPAMIHLRTGVPIYPFMGGREPDGRYLVKIMPPLDVPKTGDFRKDIETITTALNSVLEKYIKEHPDQWLWMHRRWK
jgi:KDO2-lipid IV(A) lauroyltransferase